MFMRSHAIFTATALFAADQLIKYTLVTKGIFVSLAPWASIRVTKNAGTAFSLPFPSLLLIILSTLAIGAIVIFWMRKKTQTQASIIGFGLFLGGAFSNLLDRIMHGAVTDYLNVFIASVNAADIAIVLGILLMLGTESWLPKQKEGDSMGI